MSFLDLIANTPRLPGAACRGHAPLFDEGHEEGPALALCGHCRALQACRAWFYGLTPGQRPVGVVAGLVHYRNPRSRRSTIIDKKGNNIER